MKKKEMTIPDSIACLDPIKIKNGLPVYADNPYISPSKGFSIQVRKDMSLVGSGLEIKDTAEKDVSVGVIGKIQMVDTEQFIKLYTKNVSIMFDLSLTAQKALIAVFLAVQKQSIDKATIFLSYGEAEIYYQELGIQKYPKKSSFSTGMRTLLKNEFLALHPRGDSWYWINPNLIFNGDRVRFVNEYRLKRKEDEEAALQE